MNRAELSKALATHTRVQSIGPNSTGKDYFTGDLHGQLDALKRALKKNHFNPNTDRLFTVGNLFDYGAQSAQMFELLAQPWFFSVLGIHELIIRYALESGHYLQWHTHGGEWAFDKNMQPLAKISKKMKALNKLPVAIELTHRKHGQFALLSASPGEIKDWSDSQTLSADKLLNCLVDEELPKRKVERVPSIDCIIVGNSAADKPWARANIVGINLGSRYLPQYGHLELFKSKKLLKISDKRSLFSPLKRNTTHY